ncbi:MAG: CoA transferase [Chloroflexi bacterium]|nr:CoA transferase [Chloroflexota bacterium]MDA1241063.1 CoA transferase [Chloroflexota bacterium]
MAGPLSGIKVLDFTWALAGPYGVMILADLGAEVWKIETPFQTEKRRAAGPYVHGVSTYFFSVNRGKKSIMLDLKAPEAKEIIHRLVKEVDVVTENFSPGSMDRLGFGYEDLKAVNPKIIYASTSGFGQTGPYRSRGAVDIIVQGMGGLLSTTGHESDPLPSRAGYSIGDMSAGMFTAIGVLSALVERGKSGEGQHVDVAMLDSQVALMENPIIRHLATGEVQKRAGLRHPLSTPHQALPAKDGWIVVAGVKDNNWQLFLGKIGLDHLIADERFMLNADRTRNYDILEPLLFEATRQRTVNEWLDELGEHFLIGPLNTIADVVKDPQVLHRNMIVELPTWTGKTLKVSNTPVKLSRTPGGPERGAPRPGEHTMDVLTQVGFTEAELQSMLERHVLGTGPSEE